MRNLKESNKKKKSNISPFGSTTTEMLLKRRQKYGHGWTWNDRRCSRTCAEVQRYRFGQDVTTKVTPTPSKTNVNGKSSKNGIKPFLKWKMLRTNELIHFQGFKKQAKIVSNCFSCYNGMASDGRCELVCSYLGTSAKRSNLSRDKQYPIQEP